MKRSLISFWAKRNVGILGGSFPKRPLHQFNFDTDEEVIENYFDNFMLIGINLPDSKNLLTETAVEKLCKSVEKLQSNNKITSAVLHGCGGNFCTGLVPSQVAVDRSRDLLEALYNGKKPIVASLNGYTTNFGFQLALMCDLRVMEEQSLASFGIDSLRSQISPIVYHKLALTVGLPKAMEMVLTKCTWTANYAKEAGFSNRTVQCGSGLGQSIIWAQSIVTYLTMEGAIAEKSKIHAALHKIVQ